LKKYLGINEGNVRIYDLTQQLARVEDWFIDRFGIDVIDLGSAYLTEDKDWYNVEVNGIEAQFPTYFQPRHNPDDSFDVLYSDGTILGTMSKATLYIDQTYYPFAEGYPENLTFQSISLLHQKPEHRNIL